MKINKLVIYIISFYQKYISRIFIPSCRFYPSCSEYSKQAFIKHSFIKAFCLSICRVIRCNPWNSGGYDPLK